jgi:hypothetical protein
MPRLFLLVTEVPPGEAPAWVREKWVGLKLPLAQRSSRPIRCTTSGVLTGPRSVFAALRALLTGKLARSEGYVVDARAALEILELAHPEAHRGGGKTLRMCFDRSVSSYFKSVRAKSLSSRKAAAHDGPLWVEGV